MFSGYLFFVCVLCTGVRSQTFEHESHQTPEVISHHAGADIVLYCNATTCPDHKHKLIWEYKAFQPDFKHTKCAEFHQELNKEYMEGNSSWRVLDNHLHSRKKCVSNLELKKVDVRVNGLYVCSFNKKVMKAYEVRVTDSPELLGVVPSNVTVNQNMQVIIQCRVFSKQRPLIKWFKVSDRSKYDIKYCDKFYSLINISVQIHPVEANIYVSKLNIHSARDVDSGTYVCAAITENGGDLKDAVVKVITTGNSWYPNTSFSLLFLIPLAFALVPITVWLCYYRKKRKNKTIVNTLQVKRDKNLTKPIIVRRKEPVGASVVYSPKSV